MTGDEPDRDALTFYLRFQRSSVAAIVAGLDEDAWHTPALPTGWTIAGMVQHLGDMEGHWWRAVIEGRHVDLPYDEGRPPYDPTAAFGTDRPAEEVLAYYHEQCAYGDEVLARTPLGAAPLGRHSDDDAEYVPTVRWVVLHVIEETAAHSGHLEAARELLDGRTDLGLR